MINILGKFVVLYFRLIRFFVILIMLFKMLFKILWKGIKILMFDYYIVFIIFYYGGERIVVYFKLKLICLCFELFV